MEERDNRNCKGESVRIALLEDVVESSLLNSILNERAIPHAIVSFHDSAYDGVFQMQNGWGAVDGPIERREEIMEILNRLRNASDADPIDEPE